MPDSLTPFDYLKLVARCGTLNEFNRLHIGLDNFLAPRELADIAHLASTTPLPPPAAAWLERVRQRSPSLLDTPQRFRRRAFSAGATLYSDPDAATQGKRLLVTFNGIAGRMMMPTPMFLQCIDAGCWDVVLLTTTPQTSFLHGVKKGHKDLPSLVRDVETVIAPAQYESVTTFGVSSGGYPAAWAAILMGARRGISVSGVPPRTSLHPATGRRPLVYQPGTKPHGIDLRFVYGADHPRDHQSALALREIFGGELWPISGVAAHNVLWVMLRQGQFVRFLDEALS